MRNIEIAADAYAKAKVKHYVMKRGGSAPAAVAQNVYDWAFSSFLKSPEQK